MRMDYKKSLALRLEGYSYNEINALLGIPQSTLSNWFTGMQLSEKAQSRISKRVKEGSLRGLTKKNILQTYNAINRAATIRKNACSRIRKLNKRELLLVGAALYWAEGYRRPVLRGGKMRTYHAISFSNADPLMIKAFMIFLKDILSIPQDKVRIGVRIFEHSNENEAMLYWGRVTGLPPKNFYKTYYGISKSSMGIRPYNRLPYGTIQVRIGDTKNFHRIMGFIDGISKNFQN